MKFTYKRKEKESPWVSGRFGDYSYEAKVFDNPSEYGYKEGRVDDFYIYDSEGEEVVGYSDQFIEGSWRHHLYKPLVEELENLPTSVEGYYNRIKKYWGF